MANAAAKAAFRRTARRLSNVGSNGTSAQTIANIRVEEIALALAHRSVWAPDLVLAINVLCDLRAQGWQLRVKRDRISALPPTASVDSVAEEKERIRAAHLVERDAQLRQPSVRKFVREMERRRPFKGGWHSIFSLMRDGRELVGAARQAAQLPPSDRTAVLARMIDPYVEVVTPNATCAHTGLFLSDIWRYFRHTWTTTYQSTPGRKIFYLIRDRASACHPVIGIGALGSAIVQLSVRDEWIGWTGARLIATIRKSPTTSWARWLDRSLRELIDGVMVSDFVQEGVLSRSLISEPTENVIRNLLKLSKDERAIHHLYPSRDSHKKASLSASTSRWRTEARTHLFRSKRAKALADLLEARKRLQTAGFRAPTTADLKKALASSHGVRAIQSILRRVKGANVGIHMMDITVCGAVAPYNHLLGGKLVSLLMASPAVVDAYNRRYRNANSVIASSVAGQAVTRTPHLVLLGTTSLYGVGASQYNRLRIPASVLKDKSGLGIEYHALGKTVGYGSYHFSAETMAAIDPVLRRLQRGRPVNSIFGEGVNPKLRKVRGALDTVGLPSDLLLQHGSPRIVYAIPLASNFRDVLIGRRRQPKYILSSESATTATIRFWRERWLMHRVENDEVQKAVESHALTYPISHGARVTLPVLPDESGPLFAAIDESSSPETPRAGRDLARPLVGRAPRAYD